MRPERADIAAPQLPGRLRWHNARRAPNMAELTAAGPVLVHFFDFAQLNSVRALPYAIAWDERYRDAGLTTLGIHSPRFRFSSQRDALGSALERLGVRHPVADDSGYAVWHDYGVKGWPSLFLWGQGGALAWYHFGEGEYQATEAAIVEELRGLDLGFQPPPALDPLRPSDAPGAGVGRPTEELFPGGSPNDAWQPDGDEALAIGYEAGGAHAAVDGAGELRVSVDDEPERTVSVPGPGVYELSSHPRHERHSLRLHVGPGVQLYSVSFAPGVV